MRAATPTGEPCPRTVRVDGTVEGDGACLGCGCCLLVQAAAFPGRPTPMAGDPACWIDEVCSVCGQVREPGHRCATATVDLDEVDSPGADGVIWTLSQSGQLNANLVRLGPHGSIPPHRNDALDVIVVGIDGGGRITIDARPQPLRPHRVILIPAGATRGIDAGAEGVRYLTIHRAREGPTITRSSRG